jgi:hypothetical protein
MEDGIYDVENGLCKQRVLVKDGVLHLSLKWFPLLFMGGDETVVCGKEHFMRARFFADVIPETEEHLKAVCELMGLAM